MLIEYLLMLLGVMLALEPSLTLTILTYPVLLGYSDLVLLIYYDPLPWVFYYESCIDSYIILLLYYNW